MTRYLPSSMLPLRSGPAYSPVSAFSSAGIVAEVRPAIATAVSAPKRESAGGSEDRTTSRFGVSAAGRPGALPLGGLLPGPVDIALAVDGRSRTGRSQTAS